MNKFVNVFIALLVASLIVIAGPVLAQGDRYASEADRIAIEREIATRGVAPIIVDLRPPPESAPIVDETRAAQVNAARVRDLVGRLNLSRVRRTLPLSPSFSAEVTRAELDHLLNDGAVLRVEHDRRLGVHQAAAAPPPQPIVSRSLQVIGALDAYWNHGGGGAGTIVAMLDSGVDADHPALAACRTDVCHCIGPTANTLRLKRPSGQTSA